MAEVYKVIPMAENFWIIQEDNVRMFLFEGEKTSLLIDTGNGGGNLREVCESLTKKPIEIVITHAHPDHTGAAGQFESGYIGENEYDSYVNSPFVAPNLKLETVKEGDIFSVGEYSFEVIAAPGHTRGSIVLLDRAKKLLLSNDTVQEGPIFMIDPQTSSLDDFIATMNKLNSMSDDIETIYTAHNALQIDKSYLKILAEGAEKLKKHELDGMDCPFPLPFPAKLYVYGKVKFLAL